MIHIITERATTKQIKEMLEALQAYIKLAVDIRRRVVAGGGELHADCKAALLEDGSQQTDVWGADWIPASREVQFESLINVRPAQGNRAMTIADPAIRAAVEAIVRARFHPA